MEYFLSLVVVTLKKQVHEEFLRLTVVDDFCFLFQMKPRIELSLAAVLLVVGVTLAQDSLFECPRGKSNHFIEAIHWPVL